MTNENPVPSTSHAWNAIVNFIERLLLEHPVPWFAGVTKENGKLEHVVTDKSGRVLLICEDAEYAVAYAHFVNEEYTT